MMHTGVIFDIEEFTLHDGPGIRKTVYFKGCPLRCNWCHNPEGISFERELLVSRASCLSCGKCVDVCGKSISKKCRLCGKCITACPLSLRKICGKVYKANDLAKELLKGREILDESGGGITISGGEPLSQPEFLEELIAELGSIHIAVETSGYASSDVFKKIISSVDLVLMDLKHTDSVIHKKFTGVGNELILDNLKQLCASKTDFHLRIPLIPGVNDTLENMEKTAEFASSAKNIVCVELLPYHTTAGAKYPMLNKKYTPLFDVNAKPNIYTESFQKYNIRSEVL